MRSNLTRLGGLCLVTLAVSSVLVAAMAQERQVEAAPVVYVVPIDGVVDLGQKIADFRADTRAMAEAFRQGDLGIMTPPGSTMPGSARTWDVRSHDSCSTRELG